MVVRNLFCGDNLLAMRQMNIDGNNNLIDLIYLDPPFCTGKARLSVNDSGMTYKDNWDITDVKDEWVDYIKSNYGHALCDFLETSKVIHGPKLYSYLVYMTVRLIEMRRLLRNTGSIYLHVDSKASHYLKVIMDSIFGAKNFRNEITWQRTKGSKGSASKVVRFGQNTDTILFYVMSDKSTYNPQYRQLTENELDKKFNRIDENGRAYETGNITVDDFLLGGGSYYTYKGYTPKRGWRVKESRLIEMDENNGLYWSSTGRPYRKYFRNEYKGIPLDNLWLDINVARGDERTGYPTQKPVELLERIIKASSNEGDLVFDPFCGSGTTLFAAEKLGRNWIGCDVSEETIKIISNRFVDIVPDNEWLITYVK